MSWDLWVDYHRTDEHGLTHTNIRNIAKDVQLQAGHYVIVGNEEADAAVAEVIEVRADGTVLVSVLAGPVDQHQHLLSGQRTG